MQFECTIIILKYGKLDKISFEFKYVEINSLNKGDM